MCSSQIYITLLYAATNITKFREIKSVFAAPCSGLLLVLFISEQSERPKCAQSIPLILACEWRMALKYVHKDLAALNTQQYFLARDWSFCACNVKRFDKLPCKFSLLFLTASQYIQIVYFKQLTKVFSQISLVWIIYKKNCCQESMLILRSKSDGIRHISVSIVLIMFKP